MLSENVVLLCGRGRMFKKRLRVLLLRVKRDFIHRVRPGINNARNNNNSNSAHDTRRRCPGPNSTVRSSDLIIIH